MAYPLRWLGPRQFITADDLRPTLSERSNGGSEGAATPDPLFCAYSQEQSTNMQHCVPNPGSGSPAELSLPSAVSEGFCATLVRNQYNCLCKHLCPAPGNLVLRTLLHTLIRSEPMVIVQPEFCSFESELNRNRL
jgi:hypothetical protein